MRIVLASTSKTKIEAVQTAFAERSIQLLTVNAASGINAQPINDETLTGAFNRLNEARKAEPGANLYISIENGIFKEFGDYVDRAIIAMSLSEELPHVTKSEGVIFPKHAVLEARKRGFEHTTVGKVMADMGIVKDHADPHKDLHGKSRATILAETLTKAVAELKL